MAERVEPQGLGPSPSDDALRGPIPVPVVPATPADPPVPPPSSKRATPVHKSVPPPRSPAPIQNAEATQAAPKARQAPVETVSVAPVAVTDWKTEMRRELDVCRQESFSARRVRRKGAVEVLRAQSLEHHSRMRRDRSPESQP